MSSEISVQQGFPDQLRASAAELYDAAFGAKLAIAMPNTVSRLAVLKQGFAPHYAFVALNGTELVGIAGFKTARDH
jgi:hypothetical protein